MPDCLFCNIIEGKVPSNKVFEDDRAHEFEDINPQAPTHGDFLAAQRTEDGPTL